MFLKPETLCKTSEKIDRTAERVLTIKNLKDIPRMGEKTTRRFIEHFGSEEKALESINGGDIAAISEIEGMTEKSAISLVLEALALSEGAGAKDFLRTETAYGIYERIRALISEHAHTDYARSKMHLYFPYPSRKKDRITKLQKEVRNALEVVGKLDDAGVAGHLSRVKPVKTNFAFPAIRDRVIITATQEELEAARRFSVRVHLAADQREAVDVAKGYSHVIMSTGFAGLDFPEDIDVEFLDVKRAEVWQVAPEKELAFFARNLESINSAISVFREVKRHDSHFCEKISDAEAERISQGISKVSGDSDLRSGIDSEIDRLRSVCDSLSSAIAGAEKQANAEFGTLIEKSSITVKGFDLLTAMDGSINSLFEKEIKEKYNTVTASALRALSAELHLNPAEAQYLNNFFSDEAAYPIKVDQRGVEGLRNHLARSMASRKLVLLREYARELSALKETASALVREVLNFDVSYAIGSFARRFNLSMPEIREKSSVGFTGGCNLFLEAPVPIDYSVGCSSAGDARVVLLSGVNSGGKTSALDLLAQIVILAHMGFPVPAKQCELGLVEEFYYFGKSRGTMDAGAFESTLRAFSAVANRKSKIVLADELESITEPGASAKIISGILEELDDNDGIGVFVSHLAEAILKNTGCRIRVDGIEAKGLDEHLNLIVDRNPRYNYLARSTPELIVERLARKEKGNGFYGRLLEKFKNISEKLN